MVVDLAKNEVRIRRPFSGNILTDAVVFLIKGNCYDAF